MKCSRPWVVIQSVVYFPSASLHYVSRENFLFLWLDPRQIGIRVWNLRFDSRKLLEPEPSVRFGPGSRNQAKFGVGQRWKHYKLFSWYRIGQHKLNWLCLTIFSGQELQLTHTLENDKGPIDAKYVEEGFAFKTPENAGVDIFLSSC